MISTVILCPRCEQGHFTPYGPQAVTPTREQLERFPYPAMSRVAQIYICSACGTDEAMRDFAKQPPVPPNEWPVQPKGEKA